MSSIYIFILIVYSFRVRSVALKHLLFHILNEEGASLKRPCLHGSVFTSISNLFIIEGAIELKLGDKMESIFKVSAIQILYHCYSDTLYQSFVTHLFPCFFFFPLCESVNRKIEVQREQACPAYDNLIKV